MTIIINFVKFVFNLFRLVWISARLVLFAIYLWLGVLLCGGRKNALDLYFEEIDKDSDPEFDLNDKSRLKKLISGILLCF